MLGIDLSADQVLDYLRDRLGLTLVGSPDSEALTFRIPSYRLDLVREVDLIEEVARLHGMDAIPIHPQLQLKVQPPQESVRGQQQLRKVMVAYGYHETVTFSFIGPDAARPFLPAENSLLLLEGDHKKDEPALRPSILPSLLQCRKLNQDAGNLTVKLFEVASTWRIERGQTVETVRLAGLCDAEEAVPAGRKNGGGKAAGEDAIRGLRGLLDELLERMGGQHALSGLSIEPTHEAPGMSSAAELFLNGMRWGTFGMIEASICEAAHLQTPIAAFEVEYAPLLAMYPPQRTVGGLPKFPGIERDLSLIVEESIDWSKLESTIQQAQPSLLERLEFLGTYRGKPIPAGQKSVSLRLLFRDPSRTLRHDQVDPQMSAVVDQLQQVTGATLRGQ